MRELLSVLLAVGAALLAAVGTVLRQRATVAKATGGSAWFVGGGLAFLGFGLQAAALSLGSVLLVQPLIVLSVLFALPVQTWATKIPTLAREWVLGVAVAAGVGVFIFYARPVAARHGRQTWVLDLVSRV